MNNLPDGIMTDSAVAEADLMTLLPGRVVRFSLSPVSCWWRARLRTRSLVALWLGDSPMTTASRKTGTAAAPVADGMGCGADTSQSFFGLSAKRKT